MAFISLCIIEHSKLKISVLCNHCVKKVRIQNFSDWYYPAFGPEKLRIRILFTQSMLCIKSQKTRRHFLRPREVILEYQNRKQSDVIRKVAALQLAELSEKQVTNLDRNRFCWYPFQGLQSTTPPNKKISHKMFHYEIFLLR